MKDIKLLVPDLPESISTAILLKWKKKCGEFVKLDEILVEIETDKIILEISAPIAGILHKKIFLEGELVKSKDILGIIQNSNNQIILKEKNKPVIIKSIQKNLKQSKKLKLHNITHLSPSNRRLQRFHELHNNKNSNLNLKEISKNTKNISNINHFSKNLDFKKNENNSYQLNLSIKSHNDNIQKIPMSPIRKKIAERLSLTQKNSVMLTTFNEVNMSSIIKIKNKYCDFFQEKYNIRLGYMSFFVKAVIEALKKFPILNSSKEKDTIIYHKFYNISIAVATSRGLLTPVLKNAQNMTMSDIEKKIKYFSKIGESGKLQFEDLQDGTFTITNGGIFGSLFSTPIINPPQVAILGMNNIQKRPIAIQDKIKIQPMMYLSLTYDHQIIDGQQSIKFLKYIVEILQDFSKIML
ncbi:dihydrolipoyllysine-residue succinyltransferase [Buchnera aphidicola]|uniref:dihydrolipoyllysine-residue succinyltransferase n=1 Tax=Buchnera aphidicola TaxID=9 RepID=UPI0031B8A184